MVKLNLKQSIFQLDVNTSYFPNFNKRSNQNHVSHSLVSFVFFNSLCFSAFPFAIFIGVLMAFSSFDSKKYFHNGNNIVDFVQFENYFISTVNDVFYYLTSLSLAAMSHSIFLLASSFNFSISLFLSSIFCCNALFSASLRQECWLFQI